MAFSISCPALDSNQRSAQLWWPHAALRLLRQRKRESQQLRSADADWAGVSRRGERLWGIRLVHFQPESAEPISGRYLVTAGLLPNPLRSGSELDQCRSAR